MVTVQMIALVLFAGLVGAAVPALLQLRRTLRRAEMFLETTGQRLDIALEEVSGAAANLRSAAGHAEEGFAGLHRLSSTVGGLMGFVDGALTSIRAWQPARQEPADES